jgi:hypothetical protein
MEWVVLTLVFIVAGNFGAIALSRLLKLEKDAKTVARAVLVMALIGNLIALLFALTGLAIAR